MKKSLILASILLALAGCGKENKVASNNSKEKEMTIHFHFYNSKIWDENWPVAKKLAEVTGIKLKNVAPINVTNSVEARNLLMASGDLPDIVAGQATKDLFNKYGMEGAFLPLDDLIMKYAPNIKKVLDENPEVKNAITAPDGKIYHVPYIPDGIVGKAWFIRQDWLDKLGLKTPTTVDELYDVMIAFRDRDPNGNGLKDEIPFFTREVQGWEILRLANLFGARVSGSDRTFGDFYEENGKIKHGFVQPEFKNALEHLSKWYAEKLIDPEIFTRGRKAREILYGADQGGITRDWFASTVGLNAVFKEKIPGFQIVSMAPPKDINGVQWEESERSKIKPDGWAITISNKDPEATIKFFDFIYGEEGKRIVNYGIEGEQYKLVDGKPEFLPTVFESGLAPLEYLKTVGAQVPIGYHQDYEAELATMSEDVRKQIKEYEKYPIKGFPGVIMTPEEKKVYDRIWPTLYPYMQERIQKWILGTEPLTKETWENYLKNIDNLGFDEVIEIIQTAWDRQNKK